MEGETLVVGLEQRLQVLVDLDAADLHGLEGPEEGADRQGQHRHQDVGGDEPLVAAGHFEGGDRLPLHRYSSTTVMEPAISACPRPQYSVQM